jgi:hypothetical protein
VRGTQPFERPWACRAFSQSVDADRDASDIVGLPLNSVTSCRASATAKSEYVPGASEVGTVPVMLRMNELPGSKGATDSVANVRSSALRIQSYENTSRVCVRLHAARMHMRRFTRLTNAFSKKVANHAHNVALHFMYYNFGKVHQTLRVTPAMEAGVSDHVWNVSEIVTLLG